MPTDLIRYDLLVQDALRSVVRKVLSDTARAGLLGEHHFNIAFKTQAPGVVVPPAIKSRFPEEMSIILQHEFWDLVVTQDAFEVSLNFSRKPERLTVPFDAITGFTDPSVPFGFKLEPRVSEQPAEPSERAARAPVRRPEQPARLSHAGEARAGQAADVRQARRSGRKGDRAGGRRQGRFDRRLPEEIAMGDVVNLRRARKSRERRRKEAKAAENRIAFGMTKAERRRLDSEREKAERDLDGHRLVRPDDG